MIAAPAMNAGWGGLPLRTPIYCVHFVKDYLPLSLGMIMAYARTRLNPDQFDLSVRFVSSMEELEQQLESAGPGIFLFSDYIWNVDAHLAASAWVKRRSPQSLTVHGGPSVPSYPGAGETFLRTHLHVDFGVVGEGEKTAAELLEHVVATDAPPYHIPGLRFLDGESFVQTPARQRSADLDEFPSPYLTGIFDEVHSHAIYAVLETNRGCPYSCTFCDWGSAIQQKVRYFSIERIEQEIRWICDHHMRDINVADANFGMFARDVDICRMVCDAKQRTGSPERLIVNYAKSTHQHMVEIVDMMASAGLVASGTISIQSRDPATLTAIRRRNIRTSEYDKLETEFARRQLPLDSQLMLGLPGSTLDSFKNDLRYYFFREVNVRVFNTVLLVNSPMADPAYRAEYAIEIDETGAITSTSTLTAADRRRCEELARLFRCAHTYGMLRYVLSYLFWDHSIDPIDYLETLLVDMTGENRGRYARFPLLVGLCTYDSLNEETISHLVCTPKDLDPKDRSVGPLRMIPATHIRFRERLRTEAAWPALYREVAEYTCLRYGILSSPALASVLSAQEALMPAAGRAYPFSVQLAHDFPTYYRMKMSGADDGRRLEAYGPGSMTVEDPLDLSGSGTYRQDWTLTDFWQLSSPLPGAGRSTLPRLVEELRREDLAGLASRPEPPRVAAF
jgi:hypothetical protein